MRTFTVRIRGSVYLVPMKDIVYMENELRQIRLHLADEEYLFYGTFAQAMEELDDHFLRCSRSYILNKDHIRAFRQNGQREIILDNGKRIALSKKSFERVKREFEASRKQRR